MSDDASATQEAPLTIAGAHQQLERGEVSSEELVQRCLQRIEQVDPILKACVTVMAEPGAGPGTSRRRGAQDATATQLALWHPYGHQRPYDDARRADDGWLTRLGRLDSR